MSGQPVLRLVGLFFLVGGVVLVIGAISSYYRNREALVHWASAEAVVTRSEVEVRSRRSPRYLARFEFRFTAGGREYIGSLSGSSRTFSREASEDEAKRYPIGSRHRIRYNPSNPTEIVVAADPMDYFLTSLVPGVLGLVFGAVGLAALLLPCLRAKGQ